MLREVFKKQVFIKSISNHRIQYELRYVIPVKDLSRGALAELMNPVQEYNLKKGDKVFFLPGCVVPRFKANPLLKSMGVQITKNAASADVIICGKKSEESIIHHERNRDGISKEDLLNHLNTFDPEGQQELKQILSSEDIFEIVSFENTRASYLLRERYNIAAHSMPVWVSEEKKLKDLEDAVTMQKVFLDESYLQSKLNTGQMTEDTYEQLKKMFESDDPKNHVLAMEIMANCDYKKSGIYILYLMREYAGEIYNLKEKNHVNFKAMCTFFNVMPGACYSLDQIVKILTDKNLILKEDIPKLLSIAKENFGNAIESNYFCTEISITEDLSADIEKAEQALLLSSTQESTQEDSSSTPDALDEPLS